MVCGQRKFMAILLGVTLAAAACTAGGAKAPTTSAPLSESSGPVLAPESAIEAVIPVGAGPITLVASDDAVWVENHRGNNISRIDPATNTPADRFTDVRVHCELAFGGGYLWATDDRGGTVTQFDPVSNAVVSTLLVPGACSVAVDDDELWVTTSLGSVVRLDPVSGQVVATIDLGEPQAVVRIGSDAVWVFAESRGGTLYRIEPATNVAAAGIDVSDAAFRPESIVGLEIGLESVWASGRTAQEVYRIDPSSASVEATIELPAEVGGIGIGPDAVWATGIGDGRLSRIDPSLDQVTAILETEYGFHGPPIVAFGSIWVAALDDNAVLRIDPSLVSP